VCIILKKAQYVKIGNYKFLGTFIPYFKRKIMKIDFHVNNWDFLTTQTYTYSYVPRIGEKVELFLDEVNKTFTVIDVLYKSDVIKILIK